MAANLLFEQYANNDSLFTDNKNNESQNNPVADVDVVLPEDVEMDQAKEVPEDKPSEEDKQKPEQEPDSKPSEEQKDEE